MKRTESSADFIKRKNAQFTKALEDVKSISMKDIGRKGKHKFVREAWTFMRQHNLDEKVFVIERLRKIRYEGRLSHRSSFRDGDIEYRIGYYIVGRIGNRNGRWTWGQFCPLIPARDLKKLLKKAIREKTIA